MATGPAVSASSRICGTGHPQGTGEKLAAFHGTEDYHPFTPPASTPTNGGSFEPLLGPEDAIISFPEPRYHRRGALGKARRYRYANNDMADLETCS